MRPVPSTLSGSRVHRGLVASAFCVCGVFLATAHAEPDGLVDVEASVHVDEVHHEVGDEFLIYLRANNLDEDDRASNLVIVSEIPDNLEILDYGECEGDQVVWCTDDSVRPSTSERYQVLVRAVSPGSLTLSASATADEPDPDPNNDVAVRGLDIGRSTLTNLTCKITLLIGFELADCVPVGTVTATGPSTTSNGDTTFPGTTQRFAPGFALPVSASGGLSSSSSVNSAWNTWVEPYYQDWLDPAEKTRMYVYSNNLKYNLLFHSHGQAPNNVNDLRDPDYENYDWSTIDAYMNSSPVQQGKAEVLLRLIWERGGTPDFIEDYADLDTDDERKPDISDSTVQAAFKNIHTAIAARYNNNPDLYGMIFPEFGANAGSAKNKAIKEGIASIVDHATDVYSNLMVIVYQNSGSDAWGNMKDNELVHTGYADARFFRSCGGSNSSIFSGKYDCTDSDDSIYRRAQISNASDPNTPPSGKRRIVMVSGEPNGYVLFTNSNTSNPYGESLHRDDTNADQMLNTYLWYHSGQPRAEGSDRNSGLGDGQADNPGIIPAHIIVLPNKVSAETINGRPTYLDELTPSQVNNVMRRFGAQGTKAVPALPHNWLSEAS
ncbi:MAG: hypothetical protein AAF434_08255 [Pseudomonadota bacterium]